jgi:hypothetical protein
MALVPCVKGFKKARHPATRVLDGGCKTSMGFQYSRTDDACPKPDDVTRFGSDMDLSLLE